MTDRVKQDEGRLGTCWLNEIGHGGLHEQSDRCSEWREAPPAQPEDQNKETLSPEQIQPGRVLVGSAQPEAGAMQVDFCIENDCGNFAYGNSVYCYEHRVKHGLVKPSSASPAAGEPECKHEETNEEGFCKTCGARAAIRLPIDPIGKSTTVGVSRIQDAAQAEPKTGGSGAAGEMTALDPRIFLNQWRNANLQQTDTILRLSSAQVLEVMRAYAAHQVEARERELAEHAEGFAFWQKKTMEAVQRAESAEQRIAQVEKELQGILAMVSVTERMDDERTIF